MAGQQIPKRLVYPSDTSFAQCGTYLRVNDFGHLSQIYGFSLVSTGAVSRFGENGGKLGKLTRPIVALEMLQPSKRPGTSLALESPGSLDHFPSRRWSLNTLVPLSNLESLLSNNQARCQQCQETETCPSPVAAEDDGQHTVGKRGLLTVKSACEHQRMTGNRMTPMLLDGIDKET